MKQSCITHPEFDLVVGYVMALTELEDTAQAEYDKVLTIIGDTELYEDMSMTKFNKLNAMRKKTKIEIPTDI